MISIGSQMTMGCGPQAGAVAHLYHAVWCLRLGGAARRHHGNVASATSSRARTVSASSASARQQRKPTGSASGRAVAASVRGSDEGQRSGSLSYPEARTPGPHPPNGGRVVDPASSGRRAAARRGERQRAPSWLRVLVMSALVRVWGAPLCVCPWMFGVVPTIHLAVQEPATEPSEIIAAPSRATGPAATGSRSP
jgi:hypothetical protein